MDTLGAPSQIAVALGALGDLPHPQERPAGHSVEPRVPVPLDTDPAHGEGEDGLVARTAGALWDHELQLLGDLVGPHQHARERADEDVLEPRLIELSENGVRVEQVAHLLGATAQERLIKALLGRQARQLDQANNRRGVGVEGNKRRRQVEAARPQYPAHGRKCRLDLS